jgi:endonuclease/exonuclease/phosphatase family metal-dependent hydrolase
VVLPRAVGAGTVSSAGRETLSVLSANIHRGTAEPAALVRLVDRYDVDLLSIQELTPRFARELRQAGIERRLPNAVREMHAGSSGAGIYSRLPLRKLAGQQPFFFRMPRAGARLPSGRHVRIVGVHPYPPGRGNVDIWSGALESLPSTGRGAPWLLVGDFNATLDVSLLRETVDRGYRDAGDVAGKGLEPTWPAGAWASRLPAVTIDHVLADGRLGVVDYEVEDIPGSDHRAVWAELALPKPSS